MGRRCRPLGDDPGAGHRTRHHAGQGEDRRGVAGGDGYFVRRHRVQLFRHEHRRAPDALPQRVRTDSLRLFDRFAGRSRIFLLVPQGRRHAEQTGRTGRGARRRYNGCPLLCHRASDDDDGRRDVGCRDQYPGAGCRAAGFQRPARRSRCPGYRDRLCIGLSARSDRSHPDPAGVALSAAYRRAAGGRGGRFGYGRAERPDDPADFRRNLQSCRRG